MIIFLNLEIKNQQKVCTGGKCYLTFDVMISDNEGTYFDRATMLIKYNTAVFGSKIKTNAKLTVTKGTLFDATYTIGMYDTYSDGVRLICEYSMSGNRTMLPLTPTPLLHCKIELLTPTSDWEQANLYFTDLVESANNCFYAVTPCQYAKLNYYQVNYTPTALPAITNLSPLSIVAGTDQILTITGANFGTQRGTVCFKVANNGGQTYFKGLDEQYYVTPNGWNNTQIKVKVPSYISKIFWNDTATSGVGSGKIKIKTAAGNSRESASNLQIPYSILNKPDPTDNVIRRVYLTRTNCDADVESVFSESFRTQPHIDSIVKVVDKALRDWSRLTGLTLKLDRDPAGIAINMNPSFSWNYDTISGHTVPAGYASCYQAFMHELGHVLGLDHVNQTSDLMYYQLNANIATTIINVTSSSIPVQAVQKNIADSKAIMWPTNNNPPIYPLGNILNARFTVTQSCYGANNGVIGTTVIGGKTPYSFLWKKNGVTVATTQNIGSLSPDDYNLTLTDGVSCIQNYTVTVPSVSGSTPLTLSFTTTGSNPQLYRANVAGGVPPFTYKWSVMQLETEIIIKEKTVIDCTLPQGYVNTEYMPTSYQNSNCTLKLTVTDANGCQIKGSSAGKGAMLLEDFENYACALCS
ncbi:MAG: IPT/TIG domain-containing protein [Bacteroidetes bacterium]|nr:IPT/TIG domain-containing protein [Bacteroidota bacterium]MCL1969200.1 IPT/TIG domain-containing protein [Bacteroidota bacterium]